MQYMKVGDNVMQRSIVFFCACKYLGQDFPNFSQVYIGTDVKWRQLKFKKIVGKMDDVSNLKIK